MIYGQVFVTVTSFCTTLPFPSFFSIICVSAFPSVRELMVCIFQKIFVSSCFFVSSIVTTSCGLVWSVFTATAYIASTSLQAALLSLISSSSWAVPFCISISLPKSKAVAHCHHTPSPPASKLRPHGYKG